MSEPRDIAMELEAIRRRIDATQERLRTESTKLAVLSEALWEIVATMPPPSGMAESERAEKT